MQMIYVQTCRDSREDGHKTVIMACDYSESHSSKKAAGDKDRLASIRGAM